MIIDKILDRKDGAEYNPHTFYTYIAQSGDIGGKIADAMDQDNESETRYQLEKYVLENEHNTDIIEYINSVKWL